MSEPAIQKALTAEDIFLKRDKERYLYEMREKALRDQISALYNAKQEGVVEVLLLTLPDRTLVKFIVRKFISYCLTERFRASNMQ